MRARIGDVVIDKTYHKNGRLSIECGGCCSWNNKWKPKDEPQTYVINPQEPTNDDKCFECDDFFTCDGQCDEVEDEPQTDCPWK